MKNTPFAVPMLSVACFFVLGSPLHGNITLENQQELDENYIRAALVTKKVNATKNTPLKDLKNFDFFKKIIDDQPTSVAKVDLLFSQLLHGSLENLALEEDTLIQLSITEKEKLRTKISDYKELLRIHHSLPSTLEDFRERYEYEDAPEAMTQFLFGLLREDAEEAWELAQSLREEIIIHFKADLYDSDAEEKKGEEASTNALKNALSSQQYFPEVFKSKPFKVMGMVPPKSFVPITPKLKKQKTKTLEFWGKGPRAIPADDLKIPSAAKPKQPYKAWWDKQNKKKYQNWWNRLSENQKIMAWWERLTLEEKKQEVIKYNKPYILGKGLGTWENSIFDYEKFLNDVTQGSMGEYLWNHLHRKSFSTQNNYYRLGHLSEFKQNGNLGFGPHNPFTVRALRLLERGTKRPDIGLDTIQAHLVNSANDRKNKS